MNNLVSVSNVQSGIPEMPNLVKGSASEVNNSINNDFISHPQQYPLEIKRLRRWPFRRWSWLKQDCNEKKHAQQASVGLRLRSAQYFETGSQVQISIPLRGEAQFFTGTVVLVRELSEGFEIGLWLANIEDEARARIVEKICHTECDLEKNATANLHRTAIKTDRDQAFSSSSSWLDLPSKALLGH